MIDSLINIDIPSLIVLYIACLLFFFFDLGYALLFLFKYGLKTPYTFIFVFSIIITVGYIFAEIHWIATESMESLADWNELLWLTLETAFAILLAPCLAVVKKAYDISPTKPITKLSINLTKPSVWNL